MRIKALSSLFLTAICFAIISAIFSQGISEASAACSYPSQILDLTNWKQTLPTGSNKKPTEIKQASLLTYFADPYFQVNSDCSAVVFRAPVNGVTTSNSGYPRSELREMSDNGNKNASWSTTSGTHVMYIDQAITSVPKTKKHVVAGQVHDSEDDVIVIRLEFPKLYIDINGKDGPVLDSNYTLGKRFNVKFVANKGQINIYYNGSQNPSYTLKKKGSGHYFKAGAYAQSNCSKEKSCSADNYGEVVIYNLQVKHSDSDSEVPEIQLASASNPDSEPNLEPSSTAAESDAVPVIDNISFEAEAGAASGGMRILSDDVSASGGQYVEASSLGSISYHVNVEESGKYRVAGWIKAANGSSDSFYILVDGESEGTWTLARPTKEWTYDLDDNHKIKLNAGVHTLTLKFRESGAKIDKITLVKL